MDLFSLVWDVKPLGLDQVIVLCDEFTLVVMELPSQLNESWPVIEVGYGRSFVMRNPGGFRIKNQVHQVVFVVVEKCKSNGFNRLNLFPIMNFCFKMGIKSIF